MASKPTLQDVLKKWESRASDVLDGPYGPNRRGYRRNGPSSASHTFGDRRYQPRTRMPYSKIPKYEGLAQFKMTPCVVPVTKPRPFMGLCCSKCLPFSYASVSDKRFFLLSVFNVLHIPHFHSLDSNTVLNILKRNRKSRYPDVCTHVLQSERFLSSMEKSIQTCTIERGVHKDSIPTLKAMKQNNAIAILESLKSNVSSSMLQISSLFTGQVLNRIFDGILVHKGQIEMLKAVSQENVSLLYLPIYSCHLDKVLISFIIFMNSLKIPLVTVDNDFYIPVISYFLRFLGAIFIKQYIEEDESSRDLLYCSVFENYILESLKAGYSLQLGLHNGNTNLVSSDLLSVIAESVLNENLDDVYISTVAISYEKMLLGSFVNEQLGQPKEKGSIFSSLCTIWKIMHTKFGYVRLNFGQPFSLREFLQTFQKKLLSKSEAIPHTTSVATPDDSDSEIESPFFNNSEFLINNLCRHALYDVTYSTPLMSTQLVAFLLVTQFRKGATEQQLQGSIDWLRGELYNRKRDTGFSGESHPIVKRAIELLGKTLVQSEIVDMEWTSSDLENNNLKIIIYKPVIKLPSIVELQFYAKPVVPVFLLDSLIANAVYALVNVEICHFRYCDSTFLVFREKLIGKAMELCELLQFEFIAAPPCSEISFALSDVLDHLVEKECFLLSRAAMPSNRTVRYTTKAHALSFEASDDEGEVPTIREQQLKVNLSEESISLLEFLRSILSPYIESYWLAACTLLKLIDEIKEESVLIQEMQLTAQEKLCKGLLAYEESFSVDTFKNALHLFEHWGYLETYVQDGIKIVYMNEEHNTKEHISDIIARIQQFRK